MSPLDLQRLALRVETLRQKATHGWHPADSLELRNLLTGHGHQFLPDPQRLREIAGQQERADDDEKWLRQHWRSWLSWTMRAEGLARDNDPSNPKRVIRDMLRGRPPFR